MNHYPHHIGDFNTATRHLSRLERAVYRDALDMYYDTESPLDGSDFDRLARRLLCRDTDEVAALQFVLEEFFEQQEGSLWTHHRCDREIAKFKLTQADAGVVKSNEKQRQVRSRAERSAMFSALKAAGVECKWNARMGDLRSLCTQHGIALPGPESVTPSVTPGAVTGGVTVSQRHGGGTATQNQNHNHIRPPNPPTGGVSASDSESAGQGGGVPGPAAAPVATATGTAAALCAYFPEVRRIRLEEVATLIASLAADGTVTADVLLQAAAQQSALLNAKDGKACPSVLRWLREHRWRDSDVRADVVGSVSPDWRETRSGIEAMGQRVGLGPWDSDRWRLLDDYLREVDRLLVAEREGQPA